MKSYSYETSFDRRLVILGTGCLAQGFLPLLFRHIHIQPSQVILISPDEDGNRFSSKYKVGFFRCALTQENFANILSCILGQGNCLINLALDVGSLDLLAWCQSNGVMYLDTNLEAWSGETHCLYEARERALNKRQVGNPTAVIAHGANPGLVSHFLKQALCELAFISADLSPVIVAEHDWAGLSKTLGICVVQIAERDSQISYFPSADNEFANTWSAKGLAGELCDPTELGWGTHEACVPSFTTSVESRNGQVVVFNQPAGAYKVRSWTPGAGPSAGYLVGHHEALSINELLTCSDSRERPTVFYSYDLCKDAERSTERLRQAGWVLPPKMRVMNSELCSGGNELGVLLLGRNLGYWWGSRLSLSEARSLAPENNATSLQVVAGVLSGLVWMLENPNMGVVEAEDMDFRRILAIASPYLGSLGGIHTTWRPASDVYQANVLQFKQFLLNYRFSSTGRSTHELAENK